MREIILPMMLDDPPADCWELVIRLYAAGKNITLTRDIGDMSVAFAEVWFEDDPEGPMDISRPWDVWVFETFAGWGSNHVGVVVDYTKVVHARKGTVCLDPMLPWTPYVIQILRHQSMV